MAAPPPRVRPAAPLPQRRFGVPVTIEDQVRNAYYTPDPATYHASNTHSQHMNEPKRGGKIHEGYAPSPLDHFSKTKGFVPGPGAYHSKEAAEFALPEGGRVNRNPPIQKQVYHDDYPTAAPGQYGVPSDPNRPRQVLGQFSKEVRVSKFIMDEVNRVRCNPGPGAHDVEAAAEAAKPFCPEGGRYLAGERPATFATTQADRWKDNPSPGSYEVQGSINGNKAVGKLVYRYESATIGETRDLVNRVNDTEGPGPGSYDIPEMQPPGGVPALKGRMLSHAMPHPFAYNCAPDTAGKYTKFNAVLSRNSSEQIFGTGVRKGLHGVPKQPGGKGSRPSSSGRADTITERELRASVPKVAAEQPEEEVEWRAGGFAALKKSRSTGAVKRLEHPSIQEASKCYPKLHKKSRENSQFLPMASRRTESVATHDTSNEADRMKRGKWQLGALASNLHSATSSVLVPLDEERLKREAMFGLQEKAKERMRLEGVSRKQQQAILSEMQGVLGEQVKGLGQSSYEAEWPSQIEEEMLSAPPEG